MTLGRSFRSETRQEFRAAGKVDESLREFRAGEVG